MAGRSSTATADSCGGSSYRWNASPATATRCQPTSC
jgi:hypothetical protein